MSLDKWDSEIAPLLGAIQADAIWVRLHANKIQERVNAIPARPEWTTLAMDEVSRTVAVLEEVLETLKRSQHVYAAKPIDQP